MPSESLKKVIIDSNDFSRGTTYIIAEVTIEELISVELKGKNDLTNYNSNIELHLNLFITLIPII